VSAKDDAFQEVVFDTVKAMLASGVWAQYDPSALVAYAAELVSEIDALKAPE
jgi:hypothetical protein